MSNRRNRVVNRSGFSAQQQVFGVNRRPGAHFLNGGPIGRLLLSTVSTIELSRASELRASAQQILFRITEYRPLQLAVRAPTRTQPCPFREIIVVRVSHDHWKMGARG